MNITDYLVDYLKQGNNVEIPQIGMLAVKKVAAHYDVDSATFFPTTHTLEMTNQTVGNTAFVEYLAQKECVSTSTAERFLKNYGDALAAKIEKEGECRIGDLGVLKQTSEGCYDFLPMTNLNLGEQNNISSPISGVKYIADNGDTSDPFAIYEHPAADNQPEPEIVEPEPEPEHVQPEPIEEPEPEPVVEEQPIPVEPEPEPEPVQEPEPEPIVEEPIVEETMPVEPEPIESEEPSKPIENEQSAEEKEEPAAFAPEESNDTINTLKQLDAIEQSNGDDFFADNKKKKKKRGGCLKSILFTLLAIIILLACAFAIDHYLLNSKGRNWVADKTGMEQLKMTVEDETPFEPIPTNTTTSTENKTTTEEPTDTENEDSETLEAVDTETADYDLEAARDNITNRTFSLDGIRFDANEKAAATAEVMTNMDNYLTNYLKGRKQLKNKELFLEQVNAYVGNRFETLLPDDEYDPNALLTYRDYVRESNMDMLKRLKMCHKIGDIQGELMEKSLLDNLFDKMVEQNDLTVAPTPAPVAKHATTGASNIAVRETSKQGFDIIAHVTTSKATAQNYSANLKAKGCDAYVIEKNGLFYVSMGSADSRTAAEKKYWHIKEWYTGDISIKQW